MSRVLLAAAAALLWVAAPAHAQIRGFADIGSTTFTASESFEAILGTSSGVVFGGGVEVVLPHRVFASLRASRFTADGERVFIFEGQRFGLGVPATVTVTPILVTAGYRFTLGRLAPYGGAGVGWHRYQETSDAATDEENVDEWFNGYHVMGGVEVRLTRFISAAGEAEWSAVPDALGSGANGVSAAFDEHDLGGMTFRVKVVIGR